MSSSSFPKNCDKLSVAATLISIGIVLLLAGIILLNSGDVYLLAGSDFVAASSNIFVGVILGITASVWDKKKAASMKSTARQNVIAGLYIATMSLNATTAIIMILGEGNKLLIPPKDNETDSANFVFQIRAGAYVTSVCSPIVCLVIALVCLSGNRIQIFEKMKKRNSITKTESYGWVYENNHRNQSRELIDIFQKSVNHNDSDDNVFIDKTSSRDKKFKMKSKKSKAKHSNSLSELKSPLEIWANKRRKILREITTPKPIFFADDYLQFPCHDYEPYLGTMIPRITQSSLIKSNSIDKTPTYQISALDSSENKLKIDKTMSCNPVQPHVEELNLKLASRRISCPNSMNQSPDSNCLPKQNFFGEPNDQISSPANLVPNKSSVAESFETECSKQKQVDFEGLKLAQLSENSHETVSFQNPICNPNRVNSFKRLPQNQRCNSTSSSSSGLTSETISELKAKISRMNLNENEHYERKTEFMKSFKQDFIRKSHVSESDIEDKRSTFQKLHEQYSVFSPESKPKVSLAGEVVPISVRTATINRINSIPVQSISLDTQQMHSPNLKQESSQHIQDETLKRAILSFSDDDSLFRNIKNYDEVPNRSETESNSPSLNRSERALQRMSIMGSIAESPTEDYIESDLCVTRHDTLPSESSSPLTSNKTNGQFSAAKLLNRAKSSINLSLQRASLKGSPDPSPSSLLNRLWSMKRSDTKAELSSLIMDTDSLVGLSDEELLARTHRLRQLRKSVILRSKEEIPV